MRLTETRAGAVLLDGRDCRTVPLHTLRRAIGVVPQTPFLFQVWLFAHCASIQAHKMRLVWIDLSCTLEGRMSTDVSLGTGQCG